MAAPWQVTGTTDIAPHSPVADWRCVAEGEGYGNYYDPISQQYATVTRATPKTARTADGRIVDVPAGKLALEPWSLHKTGGVGHAAIIEESRTNYLLNSYGAVNDGYRWTLASGWGFSGLRMDLFSRAIVPGVYGTTAQRLFVENVVSSGSSTYVAFTADNNTPFVAGESAYSTAWVKAFVLSGCAGTYNLAAKNTAGVQLGVVSTSIAVNDEFVRIGKAYIGLPVGTAKLHPSITVTGLSDGDSFDLTIDAVQLEKGSFATSYIPTTTAAATRNADVVKVPTAGWNASKGTMLVTGLSSPAISGFTLSWYKNSNEQYALYRSGDSYVAMTKNVTGYYDISPNPTVPSVIGLRYEVGQITRLFLNGSKSSSRNDVLPTAVSGLPASAYVGVGYGGAASWNDAPIARVTVYDTALTDAQLAATDMTTDLLTGIEGVAAPALAADWRVVPTGLGYGNYYDSVTRQWATVTRTTPKTAQIAPNRIVDVPAGQLAVVPWSLHKAGGTGYAAVIEEARTNYLLNSYGAANDGSKWTTGWAYSETFDGEVALSLVDGVYGSTATRMVASGGSKVGNLNLVASTAVGTFAAAENATVSAFYKAVLSGANVPMYLFARDAAGANLGSVSVGLVTNASYVRADKTYTNLPANTSFARLHVQVAPTGAYSIDLTMDACQLEKGAFATSYIPTTTAAATRNADVVTVPTAGWSAAAGSIVGVAGVPAKTRAAVLLTWRSSTAGNYHIHHHVAGLFKADCVLGGVENISQRAIATYPYVGAVTWGSTLRGYASGIVGSPTPNVTPLPSPQATALLGSYTSVGYSYEAPIARLAVYASALTDAQIQSAELTTELLKGLDTSKLTKEMILDETRASYSAVYISG